MYRRRFILYLLACLFGLGFHAGESWGQTQEEVLKARMAKRLEAIDALRAAGKVGENNQGFLAPRTSLAAAELAVLEAENADRKAVYALIAKKTGEPASLVGKSRAAALRKLSKQGVWLQDPKGDWYRKES